MLFDNETLDTVAALCVMKEDRAMRIKWEGEFVFVRTSGYGGIMYHYSNDGDTALCGADIEKFSLSDSIPSIHFACWKCRRLNGEEIDDETTSFTKRELERLKLLRWIG